MNHQTRIDKENRIIFCLLEGELDLDEAILLSKKLREKAAELEFNVLYEASKLREPNSSMPVHDYTVKLSTILDATILRNVKVAFVYELGSYDEFWQFYEEAARERGLKIKVFVDEKKAIRYLRN